MERQSIGDIIRENRSKQGLTQKELGEQLNVTDKAVSKWERNIARPDINTIPKLAEILDVPIEALINIPVSGRNAEDIHAETDIASTENKAAYADNDAHWVYKERTRQLLVKGMAGFGAGFLFALIMALSDGETFNLSFGILVGIFTAGVPYGWELMSNIIGRWYVVGHIGIALMVAGVKFFVALLIGWIVFPVSFLYHAIKAQKKGSKLKIILIIVLVILLAWCIFFFSVIFAGGRDKEPADAAAKYRDAVYTEADSANMTENNSYITDASAVTASPDILSVVCKNAREYVLAEENKARESNYEIVIPSSLKAAYFLSGANSEDKYYDFGTGTYVNNAILVVGHYNVNIANTSPRDEWVISVFPNFVIDANGKPSYDETSEYCEYLQANSLEDVYTWMCKEYEGMTIVPLDGSVG